LNWNKIEPEPGVFQQAEFDKVREAAKVGPVGLRLLGGSNSPPWLARTVTYFTYTEGTSGGTFYMPVWWEAEYQHRWEYMLRVVEREVGHLVDVFYQTGGATVYGEPFIRSPWQNKDAYNNLGFDWAVDRSALEALYDIAVRVWPRQRIAVSVFPWQYMKNGQPRSSLGPTSSFILDLMPDLIGANDLRETPGQPRLNTWIWMEQTGIPLFWQTARPPKIGDWRKALEWTIDFGGEYVELNRDFETYDYAELGAWGWELSK
ncbi:hypothetical protein LCGC14_2236010, partial [marine sediment metagenome]